MSRRWTQKRARLFAAGVGEEEEAQDLVGRDFARPRRDRRHRAPVWLPILISCLAAALLLASLRVSSLRMRYRLAEAVREETALLEEQRTATVELRKLRDPTRLRRLAAQQGFVLPERVVDLTPSADAP